MLFLGLQSHLLKSFFLLLAEMDAAAGPTISSSSTSPPSRHHTINSTVKKCLLQKLHKNFISSCIRTLSDNGLNGDLLSEEEERSRSDLDEEDGDSMDSDKVVGGALNLVTSATHSPRARSRSNNNHNSHRDRERERHLNNNNTNLNNNNNNHHHHHIHSHLSKNGGGGGGQANGHHGGQLSPPSPLAPSPAGIQAALAALQAGQLSLNQV